MNDANTFYLNEHLNKEAEKERQRDAADVDAVQIFNKLVSELHLDTSNYQGVKTPGWNMYYAIGDIKDSYYVPLAKAFQAGDKTEFARLFFEAISNNLAKEAKYIAEEKLENGEYK